MYKVWIIDCPSFWLYSVSSPISADDWASPNDTTTSLPSSLPLHIGAPAQHVLLSKAEHGPCSVLGHVFLGVVRPAWAVFPEFRVWHQSQWECWCEEQESSEERATSTEEVSTRRSTTHYGLLARPEHFKAEWKCRAKEKVSHSFLASLGRGLTLHMAGLWEGGEEGWWGQERVTLSWKGIRP